MIGGLVGNTTTLIVVPVPPVVWALSPLRGLRRVRLTTVWYTTVGLLEAVTKQLEHASRTLPPEDLLEVAVPARRVAAAAAAVACVVGKHKWQCCRHKEDAR